MKHPSKQQFIHPAQTHVENKVFNFEVLEKLSIKGNLLEMWHFRLWSRFWHLPFHLYLEHFRKPFFLMDFHLRCHYEPQSTHSHIHAALMWHRKGQFTLLENGSARIFYINFVWEHCGLRRNIFRRQIFLKCKGTLTTYIYLLKTFKFDRLAGKILKI